MATAAETATDFEIGRVIQRTFEAIGRNFGLFAGASLLLVGLPMLVLALAVPGAFGMAALDGFSASWFLLALAGFLFWMILTQVLQAVLIRATVFDLAGQKAAFGQTLAVALKLALPLIGLAIVAGIGIGLATLLLIFPGAMLYCAWSVAVPALVEERQGVFASLSRSSELTKGSRWKIFALLLIYIVIIWVVNATIGMIASVGGTPYFAAQIVLKAIVTSATTMISAAGVAAMYVELRSAKEGASFENLAEIFS